MSLFLLSSELRALEHIIYIVLLKSEVLSRHPVPVMVFSSQLSEAEYHSPGPFHVWLCERAGCLIYK